MINTAWAKQYIDLDLKIDKIQLPQGKMRIEPLCQQQKIIQSSGNLSSKHYSGPKQLNLGCRTNIGSRRRSQQHEHYSSNFVKILSFKTWQEVTLKITTMP